MKIAILTEQNGVFVEFPEPIFRKLLKEYVTNLGDVDQALDQIIIELKQLTITV